MIITREEAIANNQKFYCDGKPCKNGHFSKRYTSCFSCWECVRSKYYKDLEKSLEKNHNYYNSNRERILEQKKEYHQKNKKHKNEYNKKYGKENRKKLTEYENNKKKTDLNFKLRKNLRARTIAAVKNGQKAGSAVSDLGCSVEELRIYLESLFQPGMTWDNWSFDGWHIDHIKPLSSFDLTDREQFLEACHYTNLQPLWAHDNMLKGAN